MHSTSMNQYFNPLLVLTRHLKDKCQHACLILVPLNSLKTIPWTMPSINDQSVHMIAHGPQIHAPVTLHGINWGLTIIRSTALSIDCVKSSGNWLHNLRHILQVPFNPDPTTYQSQSTSKNVLVVSNQKQINIPHEILIPCFTTILHPFNWKLFNHWFLILEYCLVYHVSMSSCIKQ